MPKMYWIKDSNKFVSLREEGVWILTLEGRDKGRKMGRGREGGSKVPACKHAKTWNGNLLNFFARLNFTFHRKNIQLFEWL